MPLFNQLFSWGLSFIYLFCNAFCICMFHVRGSSSSARLPGNKPYIFMDTVSCFMLHPEGASYFTTITRFEVSYFQTDLVFKKKKL